MVALRGFTHSCGLRSQVSKKPLTLRLADVCAFTRMTPNAA